MMDIENLLIEKVDQEEHWISISDVMSGLMMIFLFISISYMLHVNNEKEKIENVAITYESLQKNLYDELYAEFKDDLVKWNAEINQDTLSVRFNEPEVFFQPGEFEIRDNFKTILLNFFPRYVKIMQKPEFVNSIEEIRIEGHTSSEWAELKGIEAYFNNMELSQDRTRSVLKFVLSLDPLKIHQKWLIEHVTANGLSSSHLILSNDMQEEKERSRRVEFRVKTDSEKQIYKIIESQRQ